MPRYRTLADGETRAIPLTKGVAVHKMSCCDCKLVHVVRMRPRKDRIELTAWRDQRTTAERRRARA